MSSNLRAAAESLLRDGKRFAIQLQDTHWDSRRDRWITACSPEGEWMVYTTPEEAEKEAATVREYLPEYTRVRVRELKLGESL